MVLQTTALPLGYAAVVIAEDNESPNLNRVRFFDKKKFLDRATHDATRATAPWSRGGAQDWKM